MNCHICQTQIGWGEERYGAYGRTMCSVNCQDKQINKINKKIKGFKNVKRRNEKINRGVKPRSRVT